MYYVTALYAQPADPNAFDHHYATVHAPLIRQIPGVRSLTAFRTESLTEQALPHYFLGRIGFDSEATLHAGMDSPEGKAAAADGANFAGAGVQVFMTYDADLDTLAQA